MIYSLRQKCPSERDMFIPSMLYSWSEHCDLVGRGGELSVGSVCICTARIRVAVAWMAGGKQKSPALSTPAMRDY
jgi:hypothetical protein